MIPMLTVVTQPKSVTSLRFVAALLCAAIAMLGAFFLSDLSLRKDLLLVAFFLTFIAYGLGSLWLLLLTQRSRLRSHRPRWLVATIPTVNICFPVSMALSSLDYGSINGLEWAGLVPVFLISAIVWFAQHINLRWSQGAA